MWVAAVTLLFSWVLIEIQEYHNNNILRSEVIDFMDRGDRFTKEDGDALEARIKRLEDAVFE